VAEEQELFECSLCGEEKSPEEFKKNRHGLTTQCKVCFGAMVSETKARNAAKAKKAAALAEEVAKLGAPDTDDDLEDDLFSDHATEVLSELLATIGRACLNASKRLSR
jgi:hypothetical protein